MAGASSGWDKLAKTLKAEIHPGLIRLIVTSVLSLFAHAVKIVGDRDVESLKIVELE